MKQIRPRELKDGLNSIIELGQKKVLMLDTEKGEVRELEKVVYVHDRIDNACILNSETFDNLSKRGLLSGKVFAFGDNNRVSMLQRGHHCALYFHCKNHGDKAFYFDYDELTGKQTGGIPYCYEYEDGLVRYLVSDYVQMENDKCGRGLMFIVC